VLFYIFLFSINPFEFLAKDLVVVDLEKSLFDFESLDNLLKFLIN